MFTKIGPILALAVAVAITGPAIGAETCPVNDTDSDKAGSYVNAVEAAVRSAASCEKAYRLLEACQLGSAADNSLANTVQSKCEPIFLDKSDSDMKKAYKKAQDGNPLVGTWLFSNLWYWTGSR